MMIEVSGVTKRFGQFIALDNTQIHVPKGSVYGLVGPNGAGKTTIIRHMAGVMRPDQGEILVDGQPVFENTGIKSRMVHIPDDLYFFPAATILDMKQFFIKTYPGFSKERFDMLGAAFPLDTKQQLRRFSRGMQKQAAFWLGLSCNPDVILLDEPVDGLDPVMRRTVWGIILQDVAQRGTTVFVSSHNLRELEDVCDHVGIMHKGKVVLERNLTELQSDIFKLQVAFAAEPPSEMEELNILHTSRSGRVHEYIVRGNQQEIVRFVERLNPILADVLPLSLEEIFIYELGGMEYAEVIL